MAKETTKPPAKIPATFKIDADLLEAARQKCRQEASKKKKPVTLSGKIQEWIEAFVNEK